MATYVLPQVQVFQDFAVLPAVEANPLSAHIAGGHAFLVRETDSTERELGNLGLYDNSTNSAYAWPNQPTASMIDQTYTKVFVQNALLQYLVDDVAAGSDITVVSGYSNRIASDTLNFASSGAYPRDASLLDRDAKVGDVVRVRGVPTGPGNTGDAVTLWTHVKSLVANSVAAVVASATADAANAPTQSASTAISQSAGAENCLSGTADGASYDGLSGGQVSETYTVTVLDGSVAGDHTTARLRVLSASGTDDIAEFSPSAIGVATPIGSHGLTVTWSDDDNVACSLSADNEGVSDIDFVAGQEWTVDVSQDFTATTATSGGTYASAEDTTYIVQVTKGGTFAELPVISVSTTNGVDQSGPHVVTGLSTAVNIGTDSVTIEFGASTLGLNYGDRFYVPVTGVASGPVRTIELADNLDATFAAADPVGIELYIRSPLLSVEQNRTGFAPLTNWDQSSTEITTNAGMLGYDATWTDNGVEQPLPVYSSTDLSYGDVYVEYRAWQSDLCGVINGVQNVSEIDEISGSLTPDNPLKWGVFKALENNNSTPVLYTAICNPDDPDSWTEMLEIASSRDDVYNMVPLSRNSTVLSAYQAHINSSSSPNEGLWRVAWFSLSAVPEIPLVSTGSSVPNHTAPTTTDGQVALAVFEDDPGTSGTQYTIVRVPENNAAFITNGVKPGDTVRGLYSGDGFGNFDYSEFTVAEVQSEGQLRLASGPGAPQTVPAQIEVWRNLNAAEESVEIAQTAGAWNNRRIRAVWPNTIESSGTIQEGYHLCAALAGLASGVLPQQGLTNVSISGFSSATQTTDKFSKTQLDTMALSGVWIVSQAIDGEIYTRQALTTGDYEDINQREEMLTRNVDSISYRFKDYFAPFIGVTNVTPTMEATIRGGMLKLIRLLKSERSTVQLGGQLVDAEIDRFFVSEIFKDRYVAYVSLEVPYALNNIELHLVV